MNMRFIFWLLCSVLSVVPCVYGSEKDPLDENYHAWVEIQKKRIATAMKENMAVDQRIINKAQLAMFDDDPLIAAEIKKVAMAMKAYQAQRKKIIRLEIKKAAAEAAQEKGELVPAATSGAEGPSGVSRLKAAWQTAPRLRKFLQTIAVVLPVIGLSILGHWLEETFKADVAEVENKMLREKCVQTYAEKAQKKINENLKNPNWTVKEIEVAENAENAEQIAKNNAASMAAKAKLYDDEVRNVDRELLGEPNHESRNIMLRELNQRLQDPGYKDYYSNSVIRAAQKTIAGTVQMNALSMYLSQKEALRREHNPTLFEQFKDKASKKFDDLLGPSPEKKDN